MGGVGAKGHRSSPDRGLKIASRFALTLRSRIASSPLSNSCKVYVLRFDPDELLCLCCVRPGFFMLHPGLSLPSSPSPDSRTPAPAGAVCLYSGSRVSCSCAPVLSSLACSSVCVSTPCPARAGDENVSSPSPA
jgi:hypothetical protein